MKPSDRKATESCDVILGTFSMASEGMDIPTLDSIILASPKSNIVQPIGRILRKQHTERPALVYDIVDNFSHFSRQGIKRRRFYKKCKYLIVTSTVQDTVDKTGLDLYNDSKIDTDIFFDPKAVVEKKLNEAEKLKQVIIFVHFNFF